MDIDEEDDFYAPEEPSTEPSAPQAAAATVTDAPAEPKAEDQDDLEEGEEEDEGGSMDEDEDDSDIDIITERKDGTKAAPPSQSKYSEIRNIPQRTTANDTQVKAAAPMKQEQAKDATGAESAPVSTSTVDINAIPIHKGTGKPITQVNIDEDLPENDKPWRKPGTDLSDYFNYGFDEFTWALYASKQDTLRGEYDQDAISQNNKKMMEDINNMMMMGGMPGMSMPGMSGGAGGANASGGASGAGGSMPAMPGMDGIPPEMQAMMQQMMASGMDPSQMDPSAMSAMFSGMQNAGGAQAAQGGQGQNFGGAGFGGGAGQGYGGYDQQGGGAGRGGYGGGRGRGGRRNWQ